MTQVTGVQEFFEAMVEVRPVGGAWTDISGWGATVAVSGRDRQVGEGFTHDGSHAIVGHGKLQPLDVTVRIVYTEGGIDPYAIVLPPLENHTVFQVRWSPYGGQAGEKQYTTNLTHSHVISCPAPSGEAGSGDPIMLEFTVRTSDIVDSEIVTALIVFNATQIARSMDFYSAPPHTPTWTDIKLGALAGPDIGNVVNCVVAPNGSAWALTYKDESTLGDNGIFYCADVLVSIPVWSLIQSVSDYRTACAALVYPIALSVDDDNVFYTQADGVKMFGHGTTTVTWVTPASLPGGRAALNTQFSVGKIAGIPGVRGGHSPAATPGKAIITMNGGIDTLALYSTVAQDTRCVAGNHAISLPGVGLIHYTDSAVLNGSTITIIYADPDGNMPVISDGVNVLTVRTSTGSLMNLAVAVASPLAAFGAARTGAGFCFGLAGYGEIIWLAADYLATSNFIAMRDTDGVWIDKTGDFNTAIGAWGGTTGGITPMPMTISV
jgi:hypothetical protein